MAEGSLGGSVLFTPWRLCDELEDLGLNYHYIHAWYATVLIMLGNGSEPNYSSQAAFAVFLMLVGIFISSVASSDANPI